MRYIISSLLTSAALAAPALAEVPRVVTDTPAIQSLAAQVMGDLGQPDLLLDKGANAHDFQLRPSKAAALADAGLVLWIGPEMTPWLARALDGLAPDIPRLALLHAPGTHVREFGHENEHDHAHATDADHGDHGHEDHDHDHDHGDHAAEEEGHGHSHDGIDPHAWLDPANARHWLGIIAAELSRLDPENAATYAGNAEAAGTRIDALDAELAALTAPLKDRPFVTFHDAYGYFTDHYGLTSAGSIAIGDASSPGAARLNALSANLAQGAVLCLFPEAQHDPALVARMAEGTTVTVGAALDPEGSQLDPGPDAYAAILRNLATALADCLNG